MEAGLRAQTWEMADVASDGMTGFPGGGDNSVAAADAAAQLAGLHMGATEGGDVAEEASSAGGEEDWLLCAVVVSGKGLYVGDGTLGDLFCMLHTSDGVCRSRTAVTGMVYSNASPSWPSNGNGNAFVLPVRRSERETHLVVTVWDGSESLEEAIPVGKVHVRLSSFMAVPAGGTGGQRDEAPPKYEYDVDLVPRLAELSQGEAKLTLMLERADIIFEQESAKDQALADLLRRLAMARKKDRLKRLMQWDREYVGHGNSRQHGPPHSRDYSLVALLTQDPAAENGAEQQGSQSGQGLGRPAGGRPSDAVSNTSETHGDSVAASLDSNVLLAKAPVEGMVELLSEGQGAGRGRLVSAPVRAQAELLSRLKYVTLEDGDVVMARGSFPNSFFYIVRGECLVTVRYTLNPKP